MQYECPDRHFIFLEQFSLFFRYYAFVDTEEYLADQLFTQEKIRVRFSWECHRADSNYCIVFCKIRKCDEQAFLAALQKLQAKMLLYGYTDYPDFCHKFQKILQKCQKGEDIYEQACPIEQTE